jgi:XTP/dITP diphosphohydrolase
MTGRRLTGDRLLVATHNRGKLAEFSALLGPYGITAVGAGEMGLPEPAETETTYLGNARIKAFAAARATGLPALADDSGIEVAALDGAPGVHTAEWATKPDGTRDFRMAMNRTWAELEARGAPEPRRARFRATFVLAWPDGDERDFEGIVEGHLTWPPRGAEGHGYDPMFVPEGHVITFAEMPPAEKDRISHRAAAFRRLAQILGPEP